ncbi:pyridoxal phosphate-dependent aminotransferase [Hippea maritima]|uniref:Aminotransferase n=1 Tax=Hippea maritima (strain ATCC 700847 / DSM 10411 / MH2) TaxID=760142 RepID=F2LWS5_HIPMA|nr:aminotransferase class I/II-fold pyridoxal phosphate-dependent enzyme [Hippea maritima]AEA33053.1 Histidinol-phosphate transaminase [Hippea maritima DSM 10411]
MASEHGGNVFELAKELNTTPDKIVDLSSNVLDADLGCIELKSRLPQESPYELERLIEKRFNLKRFSVLINAGTSQFIKDICCVFRDKKGLVFEPTYVEYRKQSLNFNIDIKHVLAKEEANFGFELDKIDFSGFELTFICNPNNPTGNLLEKSDLLGMIKANPNTFFVIDEAYMDFDRDRNTLLGCEFDNLCVLRSFSKLHGLAGLRIGWLYSHNDELLKKLKSLRAPWSVSEVAIQFARLSIETDFTDRIEEVKKLRDYLIARLRGFSQIVVFDSHANFVLFRLLGADPVDFFNYFKKHRLLLRNCSNFYGLDGSFFRVSIKDRKSIELFLRLVEGYFG